MEYLWHLVGAAVVGGLVLLGRDAEGVRRHRRHQGGEVVGCPGRLGVGGAGPRRGRLLLAGSGVRWTGHPADPPVSLTGAVVLAHTAAAPPRRWQDVDDEGLLHLALPDGGTATLRLRSRDVVTVAGALASAAPDTLPPARDPRSAVRPWAVVLLAVVGVWFLAWAWLVLSGDTVQATVTAPGSEPGLCQVRWPAPGGGDSSSEVDCDDPPVGTRVEVWAVGPPFVGEAVDPHWNTVAVVLVGGLVATPGLVHVGRRTRRSGTGPLPTPVPRESLRADLLDLSGAELVRGPGEDLADVARRLSPYALRRVPPVGWECARRPDGARVPGAPRRLATTLWTPLTGVGVAVAVTSAVAGAGGLVIWGLVLAAGSTAWAAPRAVDTWRQTVAVHRAAAAPDAPAPGVLTATDTGRPQVLLVRPDGGALAVPLLVPLPVGTVSAFAAGAGGALRARGGTEPGDVVVLTLPDGRLLLPAGRATVLDRPGLHAVLAVPDLLARTEPDDPWDDEPWDDEPWPDDPRDGGTGGR